MTFSTPSSPPLATAEIFQLNKDDAFKKWRAEKLEHSTTNISDLMVEINDFAQPTDIERDRIRANCTKHNLSFYRLAGDPSTGDRQTTRKNLNAFARAFGLVTSEAHRSAGGDGIVALEVSDNKKQAGYIPYSNRRLSWHTDGYYNYHGPGHAIRAMLMHCARPAETGGENAYLDPDIAYIRLRDENPEFIQALIDPRAMTIPENREEGGELRPTNTGPVFFTGSTNKLSMRYTARSRNIIWKDDPTTRQAVAFLNHILECDPLIVRYRLAEGEGVICNNVLHNRTGFDKDVRENSARLIFRARYFERVN